MASRIYGVLRIVLVAGIIAYLAWRIYAGRDALAAIDWHWDLPGLIGALLSALVAYQCLFLAWTMLLRRSGNFAARRLGQYARVWWVSFLYRYVPGKVLLLVERVRLGALVGIPAATGAAITLIETLLSILAGLIVSLLAVSYYADAGGRGTAGIVLVTAAAIALFPWAYRLFCRLSFVRRRYPELATLRLGHLDVLLLLVPYVIYYLLLGVSFYLLVSSLPLFTLADLPGLCGIYALSHVASLIALFAPGGLGVREGAFAVQLGRFAPGGVAEALAIGTRVWFTLVETICYLAVVLFCPPLPSDPDRFR